MFGMGFFEILLVAIIAIIALGPDKLPGAMVDIAKFLKKFKSGIEDAKSSLDSELNISEMKAEANKFKAQIEDAKSTVSLDNMDLGMNNILEDDLKVEKTIENTDKIIEKEVIQEEKEEVKSSDKFKVQQKQEEK